MTAPATIEAEADPRTPGRVAYRVTSLYSPAAVQRAVAELMNADDVALAEFTHVKRVPSGGHLSFPHFEALGYVVARQPAAVAP